MAKLNRLKSALKIKNISEIVKNKEKRQHLTFSYSPNGECLWLGLGMVLNQQQLNEVLPIEFKKVTRQDVDGRRSGLNG